MHKIIIPTDYSDGALSALQYAAAIAGHSGASLHLLHAYSIPPAGAGSAVMVDISEVMEKNAEADMKDFLAKATATGKLQGLQVSTYTSHAAVTDAVNRYAEKHGCDLVVMGTLGASDIAEKILGSTAAAVSKKSEIPVMVVPGHAVFKGFKQIGLATDLEAAPDSRALHYIKALCAQFASKLTLLHVRESEDDSAARDYSKRIGTALNLPVQLQLLSGDDVDETIENRALSLQLELVATVRHDYGFFESLLHRSVSSQLVNRAALPMLILKE